MKAHARGNAANDECANHQPSRPSLEGILASQPLHLDGHGKQVSCLISSKPLTELQALQEKSSRSLTQESLNPIFSRAPHNRRWPVFS